MTPREEGFLLLCSNLGNPVRKCLTSAQLRTLATRVAGADRPSQERDLTIADLTGMGYAAEQAARILSLLEETAPLRHYLQKGKRADCIPITRVTDGYPVKLRQRLGLESPGILWAKGDPALLTKPAIALVGNREISPENAEFAAKAGREAARQGFVLISGNARGADRIAQNACLSAGGQVISIIADELDKQSLQKNLLYLSEEDYDSPFSSVRALSRNRIIHALADKTLVAQVESTKGGTWHGTVQNLKNNWSSVFCFYDGSQTVNQLVSMGATLIDSAALENLSALQDPRFSLF